MAGNKKPRKRYRPIHVQTDIVDFISNEPLDEVKRVSMLNAVHGSALQLSRGLNNPDAWHTVVNALNIAQILSETASNNALGLGAIYAAQNAMIAIGERFKDRGSLVFAGDELQAMNRGIELYEQMVVTVSKRAYARAAAETVRRKERGTVVQLKGGGQTRRFELEGMQCQQ